MNINVKYTWDIDDKYKEVFFYQLHEDAMERIMKMTIDGFTSGELHTVIYTDYEEIEVFGEWEINEN